MCPAPVEGAQGSDLNRTLRRLAVLKKDLNVPPAQLDRLIRRERGVGAEGGD
jgi:hypothetical protein